MNETSHFVAGDTSSSPCICLRGPGSAPQFLGLLVVGLEPHGLQFGVGRLGEAVTLQNVVKFSETARVEGHEGPGPQNCFIFVQFAAVGMGDGQGPQETAQSFNVPTFFKGLADRGHLADREIESGQHKHRAIGRGGAQPQSHQSPLVQDQSPLFQVILVAGVTDAEHWGSVAIRGGGGILSYNSLVSVVSEEVFDPLLASRPLVHTARVTAVKAILSTPSGHGDEKPVLRPGSGVRQRTGELNRILHKTFKIN
ncbi:hypothetical protein CDAR_4151 [Caerostris darwini]|uniref:Uncharacterized protein n=1 Tax=Caerostris darwini TaxID=1538125 RepID=A0AAV4N6H3_9ARAC|nr:hypothetical protein CDAR_4151 [Caerostris darwini]